MPHASLLARALPAALACALLAGCFTDPATRREEVRSSAFDLYSEGMAYKRHKNYVRARDKFLAAAEVSPRPAFHYEVAHAHWRLGNLEQAATWYERALAEAPDYDLARSELDLVRLQMMDRPGKIAPPPEAPPSPEEQAALAAAEPEPAIVDTPAAEPAPAEPAKPAATFDPEEPLEVAQAAPAPTPAPATPAEEPAPAPPSGGVGGGFFGTLRESFAEFQSGTTKDPPTGKAKEIDPAIARAALFPELGEGVTVDTAAERTSALDAEALGRWDEAVRRWVRVCDRTPDDPIARTGLARALGKAGGTLRAREEFEKTTTRFPEHSPAWLAYGNFLVELRRYEEAATAYREATALRPEDPSPWNNLAALQLRQNNPSAARDSASRLNEAHPDFAPGWMNRALAEDQLGNTEEALAALERYFDLSGDRRAALERWASGLRAKASGTKAP